MRFCVLFLFTVLFAVVKPSIAQPTVTIDSSEAEMKMEHMKRHLASAKQHVEKWNKDETAEKYLALSVGLIGLGIGSLQGIDRKGMKQLTVGLALVVSALTLVTSTLYPSDYKSLDNAIRLSDDLLSTMQESVDNYSKPNQIEKARADYIIDFSTAENDFKTLEATIGYSAKPAGKAKVSSGGLFLAHSVFAQSSSAIPEWTETNGVADADGRFFVGSIKNTDPDKAKAISRSNAVFNAALFLMPKHKFDPLDTRKFDQYARLANEILAVTNTSVNYDPASHEYTVYTRIKIPNDATDIKIKERPDVNVTLHSDSSLSLPEVGLTLVLKHMIHGMPFAHLYLLKGANATVPFTDNKTMADAATSNFINVGCGGLPQEATLAGVSHDPICLKLSRYSVGSASGRVNNFGTIRTEIGKFNVLLTDFKNLNIEISFSPVD